MVIAVLFFAMISAKDSYSQEAGGWRINVNNVSNSGPCVITTVGSIEVDCVVDDISDPDCSVSASLTMTFSGQGCPFSGMTIHIKFSGSKNAGFTGDDQQSIYYMTNYPEIYDHVEYIVYEYTS